MSLFDGFKKKTTDTKKKEDTTIGNAVFVPSTSNKESNSTEPIGFYFENVLELAIYGKLFSNGRTVNWISAKNYLEQYQKGYQLYEKRKYAQAIEEYRKCFELNPIGISARFEICEAYMRLKDWNSAKKTLLDMQNILVYDEKTIARFYRRFGFMEVEKGNYSLAAACYLYSKKFEDHPSLANELLYVRSKGGAAVLTSNPERVLSSAGVPILKLTRFDT